MVIEITLIGGFFEMDGMKEKKNDDTKWIKETTIYIYIFKNSLIPATTTTKYYVFITDLYLLRCFWIVAHCV